MFIWARSPCLHVRDIHTHNTLPVPVTTGAQSLRNHTDRHVATIASFLKLCNSLSVGRQVHDFIIKHPRYVNNTFLLNCFVEMYGHFGLVNDAQSVFDHMQKPNLYSWNILINVYGQNSDLCEASFIFGRMPLWDVVSWTSIIMAFSQHGYGCEALNLYYEMLMLAFVPNKITFLCSLQACTSLLSLVQGQDIHTALVKHGFERDKDLGTVLVLLYGKCGFSADALSVFQSIKERDVALWNAITGSIIHSGECISPLTFIQKMQFEGFNPDHVSFVSVLDACRSLHEGLATHGLVLLFGLEQNDLISNTLITTYGKYHRLQDALSVFGKMLHWTTVSWNALITAFADNLLGKETLLILFEMELGGFVPDRVSFLGVLRGCTSSETLELGYLVHHLLIESINRLDIVIENTIITMYGWCGSVDDAEFVFWKLLNANMVTWSTMIGIYNRVGKGEEALDLFSQMHFEGFKPNEAILTCALEACTLLGAYEQGQMLHAYVVEMSVDKGLVLGNTLLTFYGKCGSLHNVWTNFSRMDERDVISWTSIITGFCFGGCSKEALDLFCRMQLEGLMPDKATLLCILTAFNHDGDIDASKHFFTLIMRDCTTLDKTDHFLCMVDLLGRAGLLHEAEGLAEVAPAEVTSQACLCVLGACVIHGDIGRGSRVAGRILRMDLNIPSVHIMLSNLYAAIGRPNDAALRKAGEE